MKKVIILILTISSLFVCGCSNPKQNNNNTSVNSPTKVESNTSKKNMKNEYFFKSNISQAEDNNKTINYNDYIKKVWIVKSWTNGDYDYSSFCISKIENGKIEGKIKTASIMEPNDLYYSSDSISCLGNFTGTISNGIAECQFSDKEGDKGTIKLVFKTKDEVDATIKYIDRSQDYINSPLDGTFQFRPYNLNDLNGFSPFKDQSFTIDLDSWGNVNFVSGKFPAKYHVITMCLLTNKDGDILYSFDAPFPYAADVKAVSFKDVNKDGLKDVITIVGPHDDSDLYYASVFLQKADGSFKDDTELDHEIADSGNNKDIKSVTDYLSKKY